LFLLYQGFRRGRREFTFESHAPDAGGPVAQLVVKRHSGVVQCEVAAADGDAAIAISRAFPGRIDLGLGRAPGADSRIGQALHGLDRVTQVLDPFLGLGYTALACARLGVSCDGFELDPGYLDEAVARVRDAALGNGASAPQAPNEPQQSLW
jgi:hypothetical protein